MKKKTILCIAAILLISSILAAVYISSIPYVDVPKQSYFYDPIYWAIDNEIANGLFPEEFGSYDPCTRGQVLSFLWRAAGSPPHQSLIQNHFADLPSGWYFFEPVMWALENGIARKASDRYFGTAMPCTRGEALAFMWKTQGCPEPAQLKTDFVDVSTSAYYAKAVSWACEKGITSGFTENRFMPNEICTRGQVITFIYRMMNPNEIKLTHPSDYE